MIYNKDIIPIDKQVDFFDWQLRELYDSFQAYLKTSLKSHFINRTAFIGKVHGVDKSRGNLIIKFPKGMTPRLNDHLIAFLFMKIPQNNGELDWSLTYEKFRESHVVEETDASPIYYLQSEQDSSFVGFREIEQKFTSIISNQLEKGNKLSVLFAQKDPPYRYLQNLKNFVRHFKEDEILNLTLKKDLSAWNPKVFSNALSKQKQILQAFESHSEIVIQGPPGTGKSTLISEIVGAFLDLNKSVCVTALTNKALIELAEKATITEKIENDLVFKTNLSSNESKDFPKLKPANSDLTVPQGNLLLSSYFKLSDWFSEENITSMMNKDEMYDLLVIEEASQSFLSTIAAFRKLGKKVLVVGDPIQLTPIVLNEHKATLIHPKLPEYINGLSSFVSNTDRVSFFLNQTYRLSYKSARLTSYFYNTALESQKGSP